MNGQHGIFKIDVLSGEASAVVLGDGLNVYADWSSDGKKVYFNRLGVFVERELASGVERNIYDIFEAAGVRGGDLSPDRRFFAVAGVDRAAGTARLLLLPVEGGPLREIYRLAQSDVLFGDVEWTADGSALIIQRYTDSRWELWRVPVSGGMPHKLDIDPTIWRSGAGTEGTTVLRGDAGFSLSPDGRSAAVVMGKSESEIWALDLRLPNGKK
jgi:Tol biopolymer transport system component